AREETRQATWPQGVKASPRCRTRRKSDGAVKCCTSLAKQARQCRPWGQGGRATSPANATIPGGNKRTAAKASHTTIILVQFRAARPRDGRPYYDPLRRLEE